MTDTSLHSDADFDARAESDYWRTADPEDAERWATNTALFTDAADLELKVRSRASEPEWQAAVITRTDQMIVRDFVLLLLSRVGPLTDDDIYARYQAAGGRRTPQRVRTARKELVLTGLVRAASMGRSQFGNDAQRWETR